MRRIQRAFKLNLIVIDPFWFAVTCTIHYSFYLGDESGSSGQWNLGSSVVRKTELEFVAYHFSKYASKGNPGCGYI